MRVFRPTWPGNGAGIVGARATATIKLRKWDSAEHLKTEEDRVLYLEACLEEAGDDAAFIAKALGTIARAKGMTQLARDTGLGRESL